MSDREIASEINEAAADWLTRLDGEIMAPSEEAELRRWLSADPRHEGAFVRAQVVMAQAERLRALGPEYLENPGSSADWVPIRSKENDAVRPLVTRRRLLIGGGLGTLAVAAGVAGVSMQAAAATFETARGEIRSVSLDDGSRVTLNTLSALRVEYRDDKRRLALLRGEAIFEMVRDAVRPFEVEVGATVLTGTNASFAASDVAGMPVKLMMLNGDARVASDTLLNSASKQVEAGMQVTGTRGYLRPSRDALAVTPLTAEESTDTLSWRNGLLTFHDEPLRDAARQFSRYSGLVIAFSDEAIGDQTITGVYAASNPKGFAQSAALMLGLRASETGDRIVLGR